MIKIKYLCFIILFLFLIIFLLNRCCISEKFISNKYRTLDEIYKGNSSLSKVNYIHGIPEVVFIVWFGDKISNNRLKALNSLVNNLGVPYILITEKNYKYFELNNYPIHRGFQYLSGNHKSDYLRAYLLHNYGGGYHDIKYRDKNWINQWNTFSDSNIWIKSRAEKRMSSVGYNVDNIGEKMIQTKYKELGSMCWVICRPRTLYTKELLNRIHTKLDYHITKLSKYPSKKQEGYYANKPFSKVELHNVYPLRWLEIMGEIFHPLMYKYRSHINLELPGPVKKNYK